MEQPSETGPGRMGQPDLKRSQRMRRLRRMWRASPSAARAARCARGRLVVPAARSGDSSAWGHGRAGADQGPVESLERRHLDLRGKTEATDVVVLSLATPVAT